MRFLLPIFLLIAIALGAFGQISLKLGMRGASISGPVALLHAMLNPYVLLGLGLYAVSTCFWLTVISKWQLSYAYPMIALGYVFVVLLSLALFKERVVPLQWVGIALMLCGLVLVASFGHSSEKPALPDQTAQETVASR